MWVKKWRRSISASDFALTHLGSPAHEAAGDGSRKGASGAAGDGRAVQRRSSHDRAQRNGDRLRCDGNTADIGGRAFGKGAAARLPDATWARDV